MKKKLKVKTKKVCHLQVKNLNGDFTLEKRFHMAVVSRKGILKVYFDGVEK